RKHKITRAARCGYEPGHEPAAARDLDHRQVDGTHGCNESIGEPLSVPCASVGRVGEGGNGDERVEGDRLGRAREEADVGERRGEQWPRSREPAGDVTHARKWSREWGQANERERSIDR